MDAADLCYTSALDLGRMIRAGEISPVEIATAVLERLDRLNPTLNAFLTPTPDLALECARASEHRARKGELLGPLDGIPISIKDLEPMAGVRCTYGSKWTENNIATEDGVATARIRAAGGVMLGKTNTPHFGYKDMCDNLLGEPCKNPWKLDRTSGASSGGAGSAVAAGLGPVGARLGRGRLGADPGGAVWHLRTEAITGARAERHRRSLGRTLARRPDDADGARRGDAARCDGGPERPRSVVD